MAPSKKAVKKTTKKAASKPTVDEAVVVSAVVEVPTYPGRDIEEGMRSGLVVQVQSALGIKSDGWYGRKTLEAVAAFQAKEKLYVSGIVDKLTWAALFK
jgi:peptidoglycan hydrolase-like protein with peptidoglycan-binding domain